MKMMQRIAVIALFAISLLAKNAAGAKRLKGRGDSSGKDIHDDTSTVETATSPKQEHDSPGSRIAYLIGIHDDRTLEDAANLFRAIRDPRNIILIHIDSKFGYQKYVNSTLHYEITDQVRIAKAVEVESLYDCQWGRWSMLDPTLWAMKKFVDEYEGQWDVFINLSGDSLPVYTADTTASLLAGPLASINFVTASACETGLLPTPVDTFPVDWHKRMHYDQNPPFLNYVDHDGTEHKQKFVRVYFGSQWMFLQPEFCEFVLSSLKRPDSLASQLKNWLLDTNKLMSDETFLPTLLVNTFPGTLPNVEEDQSLMVPEAFSEDAVISKFFSVRYERMDEHVPRAFGHFSTEQRYEVPETFIRDGLVSHVKPWGPYFLGVYDLSNIKDSGALFIRKVSTIIDHNIINFLPVEHPNQIPEISWPHELRLSILPDWEHELELLRQHVQKATEKRQSSEDGPVSADEDL